jgi:hypothetical protein
MRGGDYLSSSFLGHQKLMLTRHNVTGHVRYTAGGNRSTPGNDTTTTAAHRPLNITPVPTAFYTFPLNKFKYCLTLFSKFFSSFAHATCSLSVSRPYLALDQIYDPFSAAIPNYTTRRNRIVREKAGVKDGVLTLYDILFQKI